MNAGKTTGSQLVGLIAWLAITFIAGYIGSRFTGGEWYAGLRKPDWTPPSEVFSPVWITLYTLMAIAAWLVWREAGFSGARVGLSFYLLQLVANGAWSWLFFGRHRIDLAMLDLVVLWILIVVTAVLFWQHNRIAGALFLPYIAWVTFAGALNGSILMLNGSSRGY